MQSGPEQAMETPLGLSLGDTPWPPHLPVAGLAKWAVLPKPKPAIQILPPGLRLGREHTILCMVEAAPWQDSEATKA